MSFEIDVKPRVRPADHERLLKEHERLRVEMDALQQENARLYTALADVREENEGLKRVLATTSEQADAYGKLSAKLRKERDALERELLRGQAKSPSYSLSGAQTGRMSASALGLPSFEQEVSRIATIHMRDRIPAATLQQIREAFIATWPELAKYREHILKAGLVQDLTAVDPVLRLRHPNGRVQAYGGVRLPPPPVQERPTHDADCVLCVPQRVTLPQLRWLRQAFLDVWPELRAPAHRQQVEFCGVVVEPHARQPELRLRKPNGGVAVFGRVSPPPAPEALAFGQGTHGQLQHPEMPQGCEEVVQMADKLADACDDFSRTARELEVTRRAMKTHPEKRELTTEVEKKITERRDRKDALRKALDEDKD